jgi:integrase
MTGENMNPVIAWYDLAAIPDDQPYGEAAAYVATLSTEVSRTAMRCAFNRALRLMHPSVEWSWNLTSRVQWRTFSPGAANCLRARLLQEIESKRISPATANLTLAAVRGAVRHSWLLGFITGEQRHRTDECLAVVRGTRPPAGRHIPTPELAALFAHLAMVDGYAARRDAVAFALMRSPGLRRAEVCALDYDDLSTNRDTLQVRGKGGKARTVHLTNGTLAAMNDYLAVRGNEPGALFESVGRHGQRRRRRITTAGLHAALVARLTSAGVAAFTCHDLRRTFAGDALSTGVDLATLQVILGHCSPITTSKYDRRPDEARAAAMRSVCIPYAAPTRGAA